MIGATEFDPNQAFTAILVGIPAIIGALAAFRAVSVSKQNRASLKTGLSNGSGEDKTVGELAADTHIHVGEVKAYAAEARVAAAKAGYAASDAAAAAAGISHKIDTTNRLLREHIQAPAHPVIDRLLREHIDSPTAHQPEEPPTEGGDT